MNKYEENLCPIFRRKATSTDYFVRSSVKTALGAVVGIKDGEKVTFHYNLYNRWRKFVKGPDNVAPVRPLVHRVQELAAPHAVHVGANVGNANFLQSLLCLLFHTRHFASEKIEKNWKKQ